MCVITCHNVFNVWPKTNLLLPVWCRDAKNLDTPDTSRSRGLRISHGYEKGALVGRMCCRVGTQSEMVGKIWQAEKGSED